MLTGIPSRQKHMNMQHLIKRSSKRKLHFTAALDSKKQIRSIICYQTTKPLVNQFWRFIVHNSEPDLKKARGDPEEIEFNLKRFMLL